MAHGPTGTGARRLRRALAAAGVAAVVVAASIAIEAAAAAGKRAARAETAAAGSVTLGYINDLSGIYQSIGFPAWNGVQTEVKLINQAGGVVIGNKRYVLKISQCEANSVSAQAVACAQSLVRDQGLKFIMGGTGPEAPGVAAVTDPAGAIFINPATALTAVLNHFPLAFNPLDGIQLKIQLAVDAIHQTFPHVKTVAVVAASDPTGPAALPYFIADFKKVGISIVDQETYDPTALDISPQLTAAKAAHPDMILLGWTQAEVAPAIAADQTIKAAPILYGWTGPGACTAFKPQLGSTPFLSSELFGADLTNPTTPLAKKFVKAYKAFIASRAGSPNPVDLPNITYSLEYIDAIPLLVKAMENAGTVTNVTAIVRALKTSQINGIEGVVKFGANRSAIIGQLQCTVNVGGQGVIKTFSTNP